MNRMSGQAFAQSYVELHKVRSLQLGLLNPDEIRKMSVAKIENERPYDDRGVPVYNGINDPRMGTMDKELRCFVCKGTQSDCPGHFGHIELARPVYHAGLLEYVRKVLRTVCFYCSKVLVRFDDKQREEMMKVRKSSTRFAKVFKLSDGIKLCDSNSGGCGHTQPKVNTCNNNLQQFTKTGLRIQVEYQDENYDQARDKKEILDPEKALKVLEKQLKHLQHSYRITNEDCMLMGFNPSISRPEYMIIRNLAVAPPPVRPSVAMSSTQKSEDDLTYAYIKIIQFNNFLKNQITKGANQTTLNEIRQNLQYYVATLMDNEIQGQPTQKHKSGKPLKAIRARLRGKEGRLRGNLMGKRVDFSARTVITPDPILRLDQLGVPITIATNMTIPETVTSENIDKMRILVQNGPNIWPGAKYIIRHDDKQIDLSALRNRSDAHLEPGYKVERHLQDDDYVIFNRQPSLHKMSLMGHRVKVLPFSTFRLNLSVTTPYNADFDGDEMNMHVPQSYETMAEIKEIMAVPKQIVTPQKNAPVMGIVQDSLLGIMLFTLKDTFIDMDIVMNLLMWIDYNGILPQPAILKPKPLWTGKQIFSLIIPDVNYQRIGEKDANKWSSLNDKNILIQRGVLHCGVMTKSTVGNASGGLVHLIWKEHGPDACRDFLSNVQLVVNNWLYTNGFTVGVQDIIAKTTTIQNIKQTLQAFKKRTQKVLQQAQMGELKSQPGKSMMETFEAKVNLKLNEARDKSGNLALDDLTSWNRLKAMVFAGSKGSNLNISQIMACVGQQNVEGKRIPFGFKKRTLPHFSKDDFGPESKGFVENCYLNGLTPSEFFFHAMGGREGLIDTAVKTAETGYIQRRLIKALEDVMVKYDGTVRTSKEQVIQFLYGEDGLAGEYIEDLTIDLLKQDNNSMETKHRFLPNNMSTLQLEELLKKSMTQDLAQEIVSDPSLTMKLQKEFDQIVKDRDDLRNIIFQKNIDDAIHIGVNVPRLLWNAKEKNIKSNNKTDLRPDYVIDEVKLLTEKLSVIPGVKIRQEPLIQEANENSTWLFRIYLRQILSSKVLIQTEKLSKQSFDWLLGEIESRFQQAIVNPGEMVGSIGAQSIGEPATQMTLNTFHNAGISSKNVTLGVPRLKEIINVAKNIKTPSMKIFMESQYKRDAKVGQKIGGQIEHTTLSHVIKSSAIYYDPDPFKTIVSQDEALLQLYNEIPDINEQQEKQSHWLLRFELDSQKMNFKSLTMSDIASKIEENFKEQVNVKHSDDNAENLVLRIRVNDIEDDEEETVCMYLKEFEDKLLYDLALKGIHEIYKVTYSKYIDNEFDAVTGAFKITKDNYVIETDGVALGKLLGFKKVDFKKTISNDIIEVLKVLGIEAVRQSLINELRFVLGTYGIYVNYRHLAILCDIMTQRGILTSITRHGINRVDTGPLRKCSFEETVEILLEAAVFSEIDPLKGITENIIMGQLAPFGTGCFDLVIDQQVLQDYAQSKNLEEIDFGGGNTPIQDDHYGRMNQPGYYDPSSMTPYQSMTPTQNDQYPESEYGQQFNTPGHAGFSPGYNYGTPAYMSPNPNQSPYGGRSPNYVPTGLSPAYHQSPIYQVTDYQPTAGGNVQTQQSPGYSPTGLHSPGYNQAGYSPAYQSSGYSGPSPLYTTPGQSAQISSSGYSPSQIISQHQSSNYSPTGLRKIFLINLFIDQSPAYSPTAHNSYSPSYSPTSPAYSQQMRYQTTSSPRYQATQAQNTPNTGQMYKPMSPAYNIQSPAYEQTNKGGYSPIKEEEEEENKKK